MLKASSHAFGVCACMCHMHACMHAVRTMPAIRRLRHARMLMACSVCACSIGACSWSILHACGMHMFLRHVCMLEAPAHARGLLTRTCVGMITCLWHDVAMRCECAHAYGKCEWMQHVCIPATRAHACVDGRTPARTHTRPHVQLPYMHKEVLERLLDLLVAVSQRAGIPAPQAPAGNLMTAHNLVRACVRVHMPMHMSMATCICRLLCSGPI